MIGFFLFFLHEGHCTAPGGLDGLPTVSSAAVRMRHRCEAQSCARRTVQLWCWKQCFQCFSSVKVGSKGFKGWRFLPLETTNQRSNKRQPAVMLIWRIILIVDIWVWCHWICHPTRLKHTTIDQGLIMMDVQDLFQLDSVGRQVSGSQSPRSGIP